MRRPANLMESWIERVMVSAVRRLFGPRTRGSAVTLPHPAFADQVASPHSAKQGARVICQPCPTNHRADLLPHTLDAAAAIQGDPIQPNRKRRSSSVSLPSASMSRPTVPSKTSCFFSCKRRARRLMGLNLVLCWCPRNFEDQSKLLLLRQEEAKRLKRQGG